MKKFTLLFAVLLFCFGVASQGFALSLGTFARVSLNPYIDENYDENSATPIGQTWKALIVAQHTPIVPGVSGTFDDPFNYFELNFFPSAFDFSSLSVSVNSPGTWNAAFTSNGLRLQSSGPGIGNGGSLILTLTYRLLGAASNPLNWSSHEPWSMNGFVRSAVDGSITAFPSTGLAPEPGSMILLGSGLLGMGLVRRYRQRRNVRA